MLNRVNAVFLGRVFTVVRRCGYWYPGNPVALAEGCG